MAHIDDIVQHNTAVGMHGIDDGRHRRTQRGDHDRHLVLDTRLNVLHQTRVGVMHDLIHRDRSHGLIWVVRLVLRKLGNHIREPRIQ